MKNKNECTVDEMLAAWENLDKTLSSSEATRLVPRRRLWVGYLTRHRRQQLLHLLRLTLVLLMLVMLVVLAHYRVCDWLALVPYTVAGCLLLYCIVGAVVALVVQRRNAPYAATPTQPVALWWLRPVRKVSLATVLLLMMLLATPTYAGSQVRVSHVEMRAKVVSDVAFILSSL